MFNLIIFLVYFTFSTPLNSSLKILLYVHGGGESFGRVAVTAVTAFPKSSAVSWSAKRIPSAMDSSILFIISASSLSCSLKYSSLSQEWHLPMIRWVGVTKDSKGNKKFNLCDCNKYSPVTRVEYASRQVQKLLRLNLLFPFQDVDASIQVEVESLGFLLTILLSQFDRNGLNIVHETFQVIVLYAGQK